MEKRIRGSKFFISCLLIGLLVVMTSCGNKKADISVDDIQGTWVNTMIQQGSHSMILNNDMTFTEIASDTHGPQQVLTYSDTYSLDGNKITINYGDYDKTSVFEVEMKDKDTMIWKSGENVLEYVREKR